MGTRGSSEVCRETAAETGRGVVAELKIQQPRGLEQTNAKMLKEKEHDMHYTYIYMYTHLY